MLSFRQASDKAGESAESSEILTVGLLQDEGFDELGDFLLLAPGEFGRNDRNRWKKSSGKTFFPVAGLSVQVHHGNDVDEI